MSGQKSKKGFLELLEFNFNNVPELINWVFDEIKRKMYKNDELNDRNKTIVDEMSFLQSIHLHMKEWDRG